MSKSLLLIEGIASLVTVVAALAAVVNNDPEYLEPPAPVASEATPGAGVEAGAPRPRRDGGGSALLQEMLDQMDRMPDRSLDGRPREPDAVLEPWPVPPPDSVRQDLVPQRPWRVH